MPTWMPEASATVRVDGLAFTTFVPVVTQFMAPMVEGAVSVMPRLALSGPVSAETLVTKAPAARSVPPFSVIASAVKAPGAAPRDASLLMRSVPPLTTVLPAFVLTPLSTRAPVPFLVMPPRPVRAPLYVVDALLPPTVRRTAAGVPAALESESVREPCRPPREAAVSVPKESVPASAAFRSRVELASAPLLPSVKPPAPTRVLPV